MSITSQRALGNQMPGEVPGLGDQAPDFELRQTFEDSVSLRALVSSGPVLLAFYVFDFGHV